MSPRDWAVTLPAGEAVPLHRHDGVEQIYVALGHVVVSIAGQPDRALGPGEALQVPRGTPHSVRATRDASALLVASWLVDQGAPLAVPVAAPVSDSADTKQQQ